MANTYINLNTAIEETGEFSWNPRSGNTAVRRYKGTEALIKSKEAELISAGWSTRVTTGAVWSLEATMQGTEGSGGTTSELPVDTWELVGNSLEKDLLQADTDNEVYLSAGDINFLRDCLDGKVDFRNYDLTAGAGTPAFDDTSGYALNVFRLIMHGTKSVIKYQPVIRKTQTVSSNYQIPGSVYRVGYVWSTAALVSFEGMPASISAQLEQSSLTVRNDGLETYTGWLKAYPTVTVASRGRSQITQEWHWGKWATSLYSLET